MDPIGSYAICALGAISLAASIFVYSVAHKKFEQAKLMSANQATLNSQNFEDQRTSNNSGAPQQTPISNSEFSSPPPPPPPPPPPSGTPKIKSQTSADVPVKNLGESNPQETAEQKPLTLKQLVNDFTESGTITSFIAGQFHTAVTNNAKLNSNVINAFNKLATTLGENHDFTKLWNQYKSDNKIT